MAWIAALVISVASRAGLTPQLQALSGPAFWLLVAAPVVLEIDSRLRPWLLRRRLANSVKVYRADADDTWTRLGITLNESIPSLPAYIEPPNVATELDQAFAEKTGSRSRPVLVLLRADRGTGSSRTLYEAIKRNFPRHQIAIVNSPDDIQAVLDGWSAWRETPIFWCGGRDAHTVARLTQSQLSLLVSRGSYVVGTVGPLQSLAEVANESLKLIDHVALTHQQVEQLAAIYPQLALEVNRDGVAALSQRPSVRNVEFNDPGSKRIVTSGRYALHVGLRCTRNLPERLPVASQLYNAKLVDWGSRKNDLGYCVSEITIETEGHYVELVLDRSDYVAFQAINIALGVEGGSGTRERALKDEFAMALSARGGSEWERPLTGFANAPSVNFLVITADNRLAFARRGGTRDNIHLYPNCVGPLVGETLSWELDGKNEPNVDRATRRAFEEELGLAIEELLPIPTRPAAVAPWYSYFNLQWNTDHYYLGLIGLARLPWSLDELRRRHLEHCMISSREAKEIIGIDWSIEETPRALLELEERVPGLLIATSDALKHYYPSQYWGEIDAAFLSALKSS